MQGERFIVKQTVNPVPMYRPTVVTASIVFWTNVATPGKTTLRMSTSCCILLAMQRTFWRVGVCDKESRKLLSGWHTPPATNRLPVGALPGHRRRRDLALSPSPTQGRASRYDRDWLLASLPSRRRIQGHQGAWRRKCPAGTRSSLRTISFRKWNVFITLGHNFVRFCNVILSSQIYTPNTDTLS